MKIAHGLDSVRKCLVIATVVLLTACSMQPVEEGRSRFVSKYDYSSRFVNDFDIGSVTDAPRQIHMMFRIKTSPDKAFELVSELDQIATWFTDIKNPSVDNSMSLNGPNALGTHSVRRCSLEDELLVEDIVYYDKNERVYAYAINQQLSTVSFPISDPVSLFTVEPDGHGGSLISWRHHFKKDFHIAAPILNFMMKLTILEPAVENLFEQYGGEWVEPVSS